MKTLIGPFSQLLPLDGLPDRGPLHDDQIGIISGGGVLVENGRVVATGTFNELRKELSRDANIQEIDGPAVALPGFVDCHTHLLWAGSRAGDFALRNAGSSYLEIKAAGGGIMDSVRATRAATDAELTRLTLDRLNELARRGVTTCEIKTGYGLDVEQELRMIKLIAELDNRHPVRVIPTCLAAHLVPADWRSSKPAYLETIVSDLLPCIQGITQRVDVFVEPTAFPVAEARPYLRAARAIGFELTVHADQFTPGGSILAVEMNARSADHLEASGEREIECLAASDTVAVALPGASLGLGMPFTPARKLLDAGARLAVASDFNPGSAPMGDLLTQASVLATYEKLTNAEVLAAITRRAALALGREDLGYLGPGAAADLLAFPVADYREITYQQGRLRPHKIWIDGKRYDN